MTSTFDTLVDVGPSTDNLFLAVRSQICLAAVGGITVQYPAHLYSLVLVPTVIPQFSFMAQRFFDHEIRRKSCLWAALIYSLPIFHFPNPLQTPTQLCHRIELIRTIPTIYISTPYLFWKARYGTCRLFVYTFLLGNPFESGYVSYVVRKVFSRGSRRS